MAGIGAIIAGGQYEQARAFASNSHHQRKAVMPTGYHAGGAGFHHGWRMRWSLCPITGPLSRSNRTGNNRRRELAYFC